MAERAAPALELNEVRRDFGDRVGLPAVSAAVGPGETLAVLGPNGSGKTTLLRVLAGLLRPSGGHAQVLGAELPDETWRLRGRVGYLSHEPLLYRDLSPRENLRLAARLHGLERERVEGRVDTLLNAVEMHERADDRMAELSAGMAKRIALCRSVLHEPELLLLDEPDSNLDARAQELARGLLGPAPGRTRVIVSHDRERAIARADQVLEL
jgi:ABC-type multidrug transport system ATPase subunit